ncbi:MAG: hypothetical protein IMZ53_11525 [Thermoplasmata archaeon]|nr:hypothetical protein [Thermoplasmata archaeon]
MKNQSILHDERTVTVENASYRLGYIVLSYGLMFVVAFRAFFYGESNWDLMALVILTGLVTTAYQGFHQILSKRWVFLFAITAVIAAVVAIGITVLIK